MGLESYEVFTITCDIPRCKEKKTSGALESLGEEGWVVMKIFDEKFSLCPEHHKELKEFFLDTKGAE